MVTGTERPVILVMRLRRLLGSWPPGQQGGTEGAAATHKDPLVPSSPDRPPAHLPPVVSGPGAAARGQAARRVGPCMFVIAERFGTYKE